MSDEIRRLSPLADEVLPPTAALEQVATGFEFTEGPLWDPRAGSLLFSDIPANRIYRWAEGVGAQVYREPSGKSNGLTWDSEGRLLACEHLNRRVSRMDRDGSVTTLAARYDNRRLNSPNDVVCSSRGRVYFSDPPYGIQSESQGALAEQEQPLNGLYMLRPGDAEPVLVGADFERPNGLAFSPDEETLYVNDTPRYHVRAFQVHEDGTLDEGRVFVHFSAEHGEGRPDGLKVDQEGNVYTTGPGGLWIVSRDGDPVAHVRTPEKGTNCAWGDDGYSLYVTAGTSIYRLRTRVHGIFAGPAR